MEERNDSPLRWKLEFEGDMYDHRYYLNSLSRHNAIVSALEEVYNVARAELKHGDYTVESMERALERVKELAWVSQDLDLD